MAKIISIANRKGGTSKTVTTQALASGVKRKGYRVLAVDMDPQADLTYNSGVDPQGKPTIFEVLTGKKTIEETIIELPRYDILPADPTLNLARQAVKDGNHLAKALKENLKKVSDNYDWIFIDNAPALDTLILCSLNTSDEVIIPCDMGLSSIRALDEMKTTIESVAKINPGLHCKGILITQYYSRSSVAKKMTEITERFAQYIDAPIYETVIRYSGDIPMAIQESMDIFDLKHKNAGTEDYARFVNEFLEKEGIR